MILRKDRKRHNDQPSGHVLQLFVSRCSRMICFAFSTGPADGSGILRNGGLESSSLLMIRSVRSRSVCRPVHLFQKLYDRPTESPKSSVS